MVKHSCILKFTFFVLFNSLHSNAEETATDLVTDLRVLDGSSFDFSKLKFNISGPNGLIDFDVQKLLSAIQNGLPGGETPQSIELNLKNGRAAFGDADRLVQNNQNQQGFRKLFSSGVSNSFFNVTEVVRNAIDSELQTERFVGAGGDISKGSDKDGQPINRAFQEASAKFRASCVFDRANNDPCQSSFREPTARCTNLNAGKKIWGMAGTPYTRILAPKYEDGVSEVRRTEFSSRKPLKSPREISATVTSTNVILNRDGVSAQIMQWGQFISHEFTQLGEMEANLSCCPDKIFESRNAARKPTPAQLEEIRNEVKRLRGHVCNAIEHPNDPVFNGFVCMHQSRSTSSINHDCSLGPRQQMNMITHVFDGSAIYGSSKQEADLLRSFSGGRMKVQVVKGVTLPPGKCERGEPANRCPFMAGDRRINTTPNLIATHTMFLIFHNKIASQLAVINPQWDDERLYQETRRIVAAIESNIHFYEYLPIVLGPNLIQKYRLGAYDGFDPLVNPSILNELAGAAMRYGHSLIDGSISLIPDNGSGTFQGIEPLFDKPDIIYDGGFKQCLKGLIQDSPWRTDNHFPNEMRNNLFRDKLDIVSLNINRGRDHGFASYMDYRRKYLLSIPRSWDELKATHPEEIVNNLRRVYTTVEDIELYIGGVTEKPVQGGLVGDLFGNIIGDGFATNRKGDRLFFQSTESGLKRDQIAVLSSFNFNQLLCEGGELERVPSKGFFRPNALGATEVSCSSLQKLRLDFWKESTPSPNGLCQWKDSSTMCCGGRLHTVRVCEGESSTCKCQGNAVLRGGICTNQCFTFDCFFKCEKIIKSTQTTRSLCTRFEDGSFVDCEV